LGALVFKWSEQAATLIWVTSILIVGWLVGVSILRETRDLIDSSTDWYRVTQKMTPEEKTEHGLVTVPDVVRIEKREDDQASSHWVFDSLSISPPRFREVARLCLSGYPFAVRALTGKGKPLSDPEWRTLKDELLGAGMIVPRSEKDDRQGFMWTGDGLDMLEQITRRKEML